MDLDVIPQVGPTVEDFGTDVASVRLVSVGVHRQHLVLGGHRQLFYVLVNEFVILELFLIEESSGTNVARVQLTVVKASM